MNKKLANAFAVTLVTLSAALPAAAQGTPVNMASPTPIADSIARLDVSTLENTTEVEPNNEAPKSVSDHKRLLNYSLAALGGGNFVDAMSSWGKIEGNPVLGRYEQFGAKSAALKGAVSGLLMVFEHYAAKKNPEVAKKLAVLNLSLASALGGVAVYNVIAHPNEP